MAKIKCKKCGEECCSCWGCNTKAFINGVCPSCIKKEQNAISSNNELPELSQSERVITISGMQSQKSATQ